MMFRNKYNISSSEFNTEAGTDIVPVFLFDSEKNEVVVVGSRSLVDEIQSYADSVDFEVIKKQLICGNETIAEAFKNGAFSAPPNMYGDTKIGAEFYTLYKQSLRESIAKYNELPEAFRSHFANLDEFLNASDDTIKTIIDGINNVEPEPSNIVMEGDNNNAE